MGEREIRDKYGGKLAKAINRAIRAEVAGGNEALDMLTQLAGAARHSRWKDDAGKETPEAAAYYRHQRDVVARMDAEVRRRWGVPPDKAAATVSAARTDGRRRPAAPRKSGPRPPSRTGRG